ncbi:hypothetical protein NIES80_14680 [Dolichospermum planctonicum]|uniref:Uncharacterized protein n=1 Tax=Dolichospermum planctonicum TaxID=136072 RepID=A0A480AFB2_9CYAN|nr:hypothetical protein NIES80_14680 [Dolichospermum planctonicum]
MKLHIPADAGVQGKELLTNYQLPSPSLCSILIASLFKDSYYATVTQKVI